MVRCWLTPCVRLLMLLMSLTGAVGEDTLLVGACIENGLIKTTYTLQIRISPVFRRYCVTIRGQRMALRCYGLQFQIQVVIVIVVADFSRVQSLQLVDLFTCSLRYRSTKDILVRSVDTEARTVSV